MTDTMPRCNDGSRRHSFAFTDATNTTLLCTSCGRTRPVEPPRSDEAERDAMLADAAATFADTLPVPEWETQR